jgi:hypothetical protein
MFLPSIIAAIKIAFLALSISSIFNYYDMSSKNQVKYRQRFEVEKHEALKHFKYLNLNQSAQEEVAPALVAARKITNVDFDTIRDRFDLEGNSCLENAQIILFSETHSSSEIITRNFQMLAKLIQPGDVVLTETSEKRPELLNGVLMRVLLAQYPGVFNDTQNKNSAQFFKLLQDQIQSSDWPFRGIHSLGWDLKFRAPNSSTNDLVDLVVEAAVILGDILIRKDKHLKNLNSVLEDIFAKLHCKKIFVIAGADHIPTSQTQERLNIYESILDMQRILQPYRHAMLTLKDYGAIPDKKTDFQDQFRSMMSGVSGTIVVLVSFLPAITPAPTKTLAFISRIMVLVYSAGSINTAPFLAVIVQGFQALPDSWHATMAAVGIGYKILNAFNSAQINYGPADTSHLNDYCPEPSN